MKIWKIAFEAEFIVTDKKNTPVNYIWNMLTSNAILQIISQKHPQCTKSWVIEWELDACQIEIKNCCPKQTISQAQDELIKLFGIVEETVKNDFWLHLCRSSVPNQNFTPVANSTKKKYITIHNMLMSEWEEKRKLTNTTWIHFHIDTNKDFKIHKTVSNWFRYLFEKWEYDKMLLSQERYDKYKQLINILIKLNFLDSSLAISSYKPLSFVNGINVDKILLNDEWNPLFSYNFISLKKPTPTQFTTEIRTPDSVCTDKQLISTTDKIYKLVHEMITT